MENKFFKEYTISNFIEDINNELVKQKLKPFTVEFIKIDLSPIDEDWSFNSIDEEIKYFNDLKIRVLNIFEVIDLKLPDYQVFFNIYKCIEKHLETLQFEIFCESLRPRFKLRDEEKNQSIFTLLKDCNLLDKTWEFYRK